MSDETNGAAAAATEDPKSAKVARRRTELAEFRPSGNATIDFLQTFENQCQLAMMIAKAGITPHKTPEAVLTVALAAQEMGMGVMTLAQNTHVIEGKLGYSADLMVGLAIKRAGVKLQVLESTTEKARIRFTREGWEPQEVEYTMEDAKRAGLASKNNWKFHPRAMLLARAKTFGIRLIADDVLAGVYSVEELSDGAVPEVDLPEPSAEPQTRVQAVADMIPDDGGPDYEMVDDEGSGAGLAGDKATVAADGDAAPEPVPQPAKPKRKKKAAPKAEEQQPEPEPEPDTELDQARKRYFATVGEHRPAWKNAPKDRRSVQKLIVDKESAKDFTVEDFDTMTAHIGKTSAKEAVPA